MAEEPSEQVRLAVAQSELEARRAVSERRFMEALLERFIARMDAIEGKQDRLGWVMLAVIALQSLSTVGQFALDYLRYAHGH